MKNRMFNIYVPSYGRAATTKTFKLLEYCTYVVRKSQEEEYRARGIETMMLTISYIVPRRTKS